MAGLLMWIATVAWAGVVVAVPGSGEPLRAGTAGLEIEIHEDAGLALEPALAALEARQFDDAARALRALAQAGGGPDLYFLEAVAHYEGGDVRRAASAAAAGLDVDPLHAPLLGLLGLVTADLGRGEEALGLLRRAESRAGELGDDELKASTLLNQGIVHLDMGDTESAFSRFTEAKSLATEAGAVGVLVLSEANLAAARELVDGVQSRDLVGQVSGSLRNGDVSGARAMLGERSPTTRREQVRLRLAEGLVLRAEGRLDQSAQALHEAIEAATEGGLVRERVVALVACSRTDVMAGRLEAARERMTEALDAVSGTHFRVRELDAALQMGFVVSELGDGAAAAVSLEHARALQTLVTDASAEPRVRELSAAVAMLSGDMTTAKALFDESLKWYTEHQYRTDAARVATMLVMVEPSQARRERALVLLRAAGDPDGPSHVAIAAGRALARDGDAAGAFEAFVQAEKQVSDSSPRARFIARVARQNAARALVALGHRSMEGDDLDGQTLLERHRVFVGAEQAYREGHSLFVSGSYSEATRRFADAGTAFASIKETEHASVAELAEAWSEWNRMAAEPPDEAVVVFEGLIKVALRLGDEELRVRSIAAAAISAGRMGRSDAATLLRNAALEADNASMGDLAGRCWAELAEQPESLFGRAAAARAAFGLRSDSVGAYAMYSVAVDAHNEGEYVLAGDLAAEVLADAGELADAVRAVLEASREQGGVTGIP